ncbi:MAG: YeeE/YedE thiosulfate transporter family protein, partial [Methyloligellaceae bacterium]
MGAIGECLVAFVFGSVVGLLVQRSRFCNTAALRDAMLFKSFRNTKALLVAMMILTIGFTGFISLGEGNAMHFDVGINQIIGLFLFGIGMVLAGACTVSTWVKSGEGNVGAMWALLFTFIGMFLFSLVWSANYWPPAPASMTGAPNLEALQL